MLTVIPIYAAGTCKLAKQENMSGLPLLLQFLGGENMLTGHTNEHWKAVRKAVAPAFSAGNMRYVTLPSWACIAPAALSNI